MKTAAPCFICRSTESKTVYRKGPWRYIECQQCGLVSLRPRPTTKSILNNYETYLPVSHLKIRQCERMMAPVIRTSVRLIESRWHQRPGNVLDIGCGFGFFLAAMKNRGWRVSGIEISESGREYARETFHLQVHGKPIETLSLPSNHFDVVTLFYVIEHLLDPVEILTEIRRILKPKGIILLRWPHTTPIVKLLGPLAGKLDLYHTPYHIHDFSKPAMEKLLFMTGYDQTETVVGGYTLSPQKLKRWASFFFASLGELMCRMSGGRWLLTGISKTTIAVKKD